MTPNEIVPKPINWIESVARRISSLSTPQTIFMVRGEMLLGHTRDKSKPGCCCCGFCGGCWYLTNHIAQFKQIEFESFILLLHMIQINICFSLPSDSASGIGFVKPYLCSILLFSLSTYLKESILNEWISIWCDKFLIWFQIGNSRYMPKIMNRPEYTRWNTDAKCYVLTQ